MGEETQKSATGQLHISFPCEIEVRLGDEEIGTFVFDRDTITIGRGPECDLVIDNLGASRIHAEIKRFGYFYIFYNKGKTGSFIHAKKVEHEHHLNDEEEIFLAKHVLRFRRISREQLEERETTGITTEKEGSPPTDERIQTVPVDYHSMAKKQEPAKAYIQVEEEANRPIPIHKNATFLGRSGFCDIIVPGWLVNSPHAVLVKEDTGFSLYHLGIFKIPEINREAKKIALLEHGDTVEIGKFRFIFQSLQG